MPDSEFLGTDDSDWVSNEVVMESWERGEYTISTDKARLDLGVIHGFLNTSYWAAGRSIETIQRSIDNSLVFGVYKGDQQIGFARVITDYATFAWLADVFVQAGFFEDPTDLYHLNRFELDQALAQLGP